MITLLHEGFQSVLPDIEDDSIDLIATDPPYAKEYEHLYYNLIEEAPRILKRGGALLTIIPHWNIPNILSEFGKHLKWRWILNMIQWEGNHPRMSMGIEITWKPIGWWVKERWNPKVDGWGKHMFFPDGFINKPPPKLNHEWEQSIDWARYCTRFCPPGGIVFDPMMGCGTMALACLEKDLHFIGVDIDQDQFNIATDAVKAHKETVAYQRSNRSSP